MLTKQIDAKVKALDGAGEPEGTFEAYAATWQTDSVKDRIAKGAFTKTLADWLATGDPIPVFWSHAMDNAFANIGTIDVAKETDEGLYVKGRFDLDGDNPMAKQVYRLAKGGRVRNLSFAYDVEDSEYVGDQKDNQGADVLLKELTLHEVSFCQIGANRGTRILSAKSAIPVSAGPKTTDDGSWDGPAAKKNLKADGDAAYYRSAFAWVDPDKDATQQGSYRFIHHNVSADGTVSAANLTACTTGIGVLNGGRGGTTIPDGDRQGVYDHLAAHITTAGNEPPELKSGEAQTKSLPGSFEARQEAISDALSGVNPATDVWAFPVATFADRVVYTVTGSGPGGGTFEAPYTIAADGTVTVGESTPVEIEESIVPVPKGGGALLKEGRMLSAANLAALKSGLQSIQNGVEKIESVTGVMDDDDVGNGPAQTGEPAKSNEDQMAKARAEEPDGKSGDAHAHVPAGDVFDPEFELARLALDHIT